MAVLVVPVDDAVIAFEPPHPLMAKTATASVPTAQNSFKFNCNGSLSAVGGRQSGQIRGASTLDISGEGIR